jgi:hypothetical protein
LPINSQIVDELYQQRLTFTEQEVTRWKYRDHLFGNLRLAVAAIFIILLCGSVFASWCSLSWLLLPLALFVALVLAHNKVARRRIIAERSVEYYQRGLTRLNDKWQGNGIPGTSYLSLAPLFGTDLDLFGTGSLYELLCSARTSAGRKLLALWLSESASVDEIRERQKAVSDLTVNSAVREALWQCGVTTKRPVDTSVLVDWGDTPAIVVSVLQRVLASLLVCFFAAAIVVLIRSRSMDLVLTASLLSLLFQRFLAGNLLKTSGYVAKHEDDLSALLDLATAIANAEDISNTATIELQETLKGAIKAIQSLKRIIGFRQLTNNQFGIVIGAILQVPFFSGAAIERWRREHMGSLRIWAESIAKFEALADLSAFAFEHPSYVFPEIADSGIKYKADNLAHPLLSRSAIGNSFTLDEETRVLVLSGSNMSGKSTLLRAIGVNLILAMAGAPVRADRCIISQLVPAASIRTQDSLLEGVSRFYAEIVRLSKIVEISQSKPCVFLLDEILSGTNSYARQIGAQSIVSKLIQGKSIGLITTHDLALERIVDEVPAALNVHLDDQIVDGKLAFDYRLKSGFVTTSNAIELMRAVGLDVS